DALRPFEQLDHDGAAPDLLDARQDVRALARKGRRGDADSVPAQDLDRAQLVARYRDRLRRVETEDAHLLELANDGGSEKGDRGADARDDGVVVAQRSIAVIEPRTPLLDENTEVQR